MPENWTAVAAFQADPCFEVGPLWPQVGRFDVSGSSQMDAVGKQWHRKQICKVEVSPGPADGRISTPPSSCFFRWGASGHAIQDGSAVYDEIHLLAHCSVSSLHDCLKHFLILQSATMPMNRPRHLSTFSR